MEENFLSFSDFEKVQLHVGTILKVSDFKKALKPAYILEINFGPVIGIKKSSAQITVRYTKEELIGKQIVAVINFPKKQIANLLSECLVLGAVDENSVILIHPGDKVKNGLRIG